MSEELKNFKFRKLKISDYKEFNKLFYSCFKKKISFEFFKWRYFSSKLSFCYGAFTSSRLIANVGMVPTKLNIKPSNIVYSRHSSMVLKKYRGIGIFSELLKKVKKKIFNKVYLIIMWPNPNNFSNFGLDKDSIIKKKYYLYQTYSNSNLLKKNMDISFNELENYKKFFENSSGLIFKNFIYFKKRYLLYRKHDYCLNKFEYNNLKSFFILKRNRDKTGLNYVLLDHFGSEKIYSKHLSYLLNNYERLIFLSEKKYNNSRYQLINYLNLKIGFVKKFNIKNKKFFLNKKKVFLGDTDIFITV